MGAYNIDLTPDDNGTFLITCPALPEVTTFAESEADAGRVARLAVEEAIAARIAGGRDVPPWQGQVTRGRPFVLVPLQTEIKVSLYWALAQTGLNRAELARRLGWHREQVDRLFRLDHASRLDQLDAAFQALGEFGVRRIAMGLGESEAPEFSRD
jgi:antitoxin HicB